MATLTPEQRHEIDRSGEEPVRLEDPDTREVFVVIREETYRKLRELAAVDHSDRSLYEFGEFYPDK